MDNKEGFTLIELLAVIAVLSLVAVIVVPKVNVIIQESRMDNYRNSVSGLLRAIDQNHTETGVTSDVYTIKNGRITPSVDYEGEFNGTGTITYDEEENVSLKIQNGKYCAIKLPNTKKIEVIVGKCNN